MAESPRYTDGSRIHFTPRCRLGGRYAELMAKARFHGINLSWLPPPPPCPVTLLSWLIPLLPRSAPLLVDPPPAPFRSSLGG